MDKIRIKIVELGNLKIKIDKQKLRKFKSDFFKIDSFEAIEILPIRPFNENNLGIAYSPNNFKEILEKKNFDGIIVGLFNYRFRDNFYMHRINENSMAVSLFDLKEILIPANIGLESFIIKCIYEAVCFYKAGGNSVSNEIYQFVHSDTRGCLFDLNGDRRDIIYNTEKPIICDECKSKLKQAQFPEFFLIKFEKELKRIDKNFLMKVELFIRRYPLFSFIMAIVGSVFLNVLSGFFQDWLKKVFSKT